MTSARQPKKPKKAVRTGRPEERVVMRPEDAEAVLRQLMRQKPKGGDKDPPMRRKA